MNCIQFKKYETGKTGDREFRQHLNTCAFCREQVQLDNRLMSLTTSLKEPVRSPRLWERIEDTLKKEEQISRKSAVSRVFTGPFSFFPAAAVILLALAVAAFFLLTTEKHSPGLLHQSALKKVEKKEKEYVKAIIELEKQTLPKLADMDLELMLLYKDRLETIDDQIKRCKEALSINPANTHIRRYMLAALQDKKETLHELLSSQQRSTTAPYKKKYHERI